MAADVALNQLSFLDAIDLFGETSHEQDGSPANRSSRNGKAPPHE
jgi:hypothetical protein